MKFSPIVIFFWIIMCCSKASENLRSKIYPDLLKGNLYENDALVYALPDRIKDKKELPTIDSFADGRNISNKTKSESKFNSILLKKNINSNKTPTLNMLVKADTIPSSFLSKHSIRDEYKTNNANDALHLINRDTDSFYDNELIMKLTDSKGDLPLKFQTVTELNGDPVLIYNATNGENQHNIKKREQKKSDHYDYSYYDEQPENDNSAIKGVQGIKEKPPNVGKMLLPKLKKVSPVKNSSELREKEVLKSIVSNKSENVISVKSLDVLKKSNSTDFNQDKPSLQNEDLEFEEDSTDSTDNRKDEKELTVGAEQNEINNNNNVISLPKGKDPCRLFNKNDGYKEPKNCLPTGGLPKVSSVLFTPKTNDSEYNKTIKGDLIDKFVKTVMDKAAKSSKISTELGICLIDFKNVRDQYNKARNKTECCMKVVEELQCFLTWMLTADVSRKKRSVNKEFIDYKTTVSRKLYDKTATCPECISVKEPSPEYVRLYEKIQQSREDDDGSWEINSINQPKDPV